MKTIPSFIFPIFPIFIREITIAENDFLLFNYAYVSLYFSG